MEVHRFLRLSPRRIAFVLVVAVVCGAITALVLRGGTGDHTARAVVFLRSADTGGGNAFTLDPFVADVEAALDLSEVERQVATAADLPVADLDVRVERPQSGSTIELRATGPTPEQAEAAVAEASRAALTVVLSQDLARATRELETIDTKVLEANADLEAFRLRNATQNPVDEYRINLETLTAVQLQLLDPNITDETVERLSAQEPALQADVNRLQPLVDPYQELVRALNRAENSQVEPQALVNRIDGALDAAQSGDLIFVDDAVPGSTSGRVVGGAAATVAAAGLLLIALLAAIDLISARSATGAGGWSSADRAGGARHRADAATGSSVDELLDELLGGADERPPGSDSTNGNDTGDRVGAGDGHGDGVTGEPTADEVGGLGAGNGDGVTGEQDTVTATSPDDGHDGQNVTGADGHDRGDDADDAQGPDDEWAAATITDSPAHDRDHADHDDHDDPDHDHDHEAAHDDHDADHDDHDDPDHDHDDHEAAHDGADAGHDEWDDDGDDGDDAGRDEWDDHGADAGHDEWDEWDDDADGAGDEWDDGDDERDDHGADDERVAVASSDHPADDQRGAGGGRGTWRSRARRAIAAVSKATAVGGATASGEAGSDSPDGSRRR